ncbi:MAG: SUF system Fe-S cluster assembly protein [Geminicoccus sp.]|nr:SUF system Fe-S cluster assembly protein [Geminicoccus sp.]
MTNDGKTLADFMPNPGVTMDPAAGVRVRREGTTFVAEAGEALPSGAVFAAQDSMIEAMQTVHDPEIPINIYDLGLIYRVDQNPATGDVEVDMTLTAPGCPVAGEMPGHVAAALARLEGVGVATVKLVWEPAWTPDRASEDAQLVLGL